MVAGYIALVLLVKGASLLQAARKSDAIDVLNKVVTRFGGAADQSISAYVADAQELLRGAECK
jgi:hypothetical protein